MSPAAVGTLRFDLSRGGGSHLAPSGVPVDIRRPNLTLVATVLSTASAEVEPGTYYVSARLSGGRVLRGQTVVRAGQTQTVVLTPDDDEEPGAPLPRSATGGRTRRGTPPQAAHAAAPAEARNTGPASVAVRLLAGNVLAGQGAPIDADRWSMTQSEAGAELTVPGENRPYLIQIWQRGRLPANMVVPTSAGYPCRLSIAEGSDGAYTARATLANPSADLLVRYAYRADVKRSTVVTVALDAETLLGAKLVDPLAAVVGAYALLKLGDLDRLHEWTETLRRGFDWLPDGLIVRGEHLARTGRHAEACDAFTELPRRGLPISSEGLSWSVDRLRSYARATPRALAPERRAQAQTVLALLQPFAMAADFRCPFTAYPGADPHRPSADPAPADPPRDAREIGQGPTV
jgi:hypothetical protein